MNAKLLIDGKEFDIEILDPKLQELLVPSKKKTGYERVGEGEKYYFSVEDGSADCDNDYLHPSDDETYDCANYYSDKTVAENNARADKLMRQLRRFAVEHREKELDWKDSLGLSMIVYGTSNQDLQICNVGWARTFGAIVFDRAATAQLAIDTFYDELLWYFTEYKDSLRGE